MLPYSQSTEYTTAACGLMCILHHFDKGFALSRENEYLVWRATVNLPTRASSIYALASFAKERGLNPKIVVGNLRYDYPDYRFKRYKKADVEQALFMSELHKARARELGIPLEERPLAFDEVVQLVKDGRVLLIRLNEGLFRRMKSTSKYVVLYGHKNGRFLLVDPALENPLIAIDEPALRESFETLTTKKKRDHRVIVF